MSNAPAPRPVSQHSDAAERREYARQVRKLVPRSTAGSWQPAPDRPDPVDLLNRQAESRDAGLVPLRHGRMLASPFAFYRGGAMIMAADLASVPNTGLKVQLCGDAHLSNFGVYAAPDRSLIFSLNDFDETLPGPFEWDIARLVASFEIAARHRRFAGSSRDKIVATVAQSYRTAMREFAALPILDLWYARLDADAILSRFGDGSTSKQRKRLASAMNKARGKNSMRALSKLTHEVDGRLRFRADPPTIVPIEDLATEHAMHDIADALEEIIVSYRASLEPDRQHLLDKYHYVHAARKVVGVGSVGTRAWVLLLAGRDHQDPLVLQFKEAQPSVLEEFLEPSAYDTHGQRIVAGQHLLQAASDILLGWHRGIGLDGKERDFFVRQLWDAKGSADLEAIDADSMKIYAAMCGWTLALAHARSGDPVAIASYLGKGRAFDRSMVAFAAHYADQNDRDYEAVRQAVAAGRLAAEDG